MKFLKVVAIALFLLGLNTVSYASNYAFLDGSAITYFTDQDRDLMMSNIYKVLNRYPDNKKSSWVNPKSKAWGYAMVTKTMRQNNGLLCRALLIVNNAHHIPGKSTYRVCKIKGSWKVT